MQLAALDGENRTAKAGRASAGCLGQATSAGAWRTKRYLVHTCLCAVNALDRESQQVVGK